MHKKALFFKETNKAISISEISSNDLNQKFKAWDAQDTGVTKDGAVYWFKIPVQYTGENLSYNFILTFDRSVDSVELFMLAPQGEVIDQGLIGSLLPIKNRTFQLNGGKSPTLSINLGSGQVTYLYGRMVYKSYLSREIGKLNFSIIDSQTYYKNEIYSHYFKGLLLSGLCFIILLNTLIFYYYREIAHILLLANAILSLLFFVSFTSDLDFLIASTSLQNAYRYLWYVSGSLFLVSYLYFTCYYFRPVIKGRWLMWSNHFISAIVFGSMIYGLIVNYRFAYNLMLVLAGFVMVYTFCIGLIGMNRKYKPALLFICASSFSMLGIMLFVASNLGIIYYYSFIDYMLQLGEVLSLTIFTFGLGYRYYLEKQVLADRLLRQEMIEMSQKAEISRLLESQNKTLELKVAERTLELEKQKKELEETNKVKDKLFSIISHDLRSPLNALGGFLKLLSLGGLSTEEVDLMTTGLTEKFNKANSLLDNLLHWARSQMQGLKLSQKLINIDSVALQIIELYETEAKQKKITLERDISKKIEVFADPAMLELVIRNLVANAVKFTPYMGRITIEAEEYDSTIEIRVKDTGIGISSHGISQILNPSEQYSTIGTGKEKGTGLGLMLSKEFIEMNGGELQIESEENKGSTFKFSLPKNA